MMGPVNNERREQALIVDEPRSRLPLGVKALYTETRTRSITSYSLDGESCPTGYPKPRTIWHQVVHFCLVAKRRLFVPGSPTTSRKSAECAHLTIRDIPHNPHQPLHALVVDHIPVWWPFQVSSHPWPAIERCFGILFINQAHQMQV